MSSRDSCERTEQKPVYEISTEAGKLWPLVVVEQVSSLPSYHKVIVENTDIYRGRLVDKSGVI